MSIASARPGSSATSALPRRPSAGHPGKGPAAGNARPGCRIDEARPETNEPAPGPIQPEPTRADRHGAGIARAADTLARPDSALPHPAPHGIGQPHADAGPESARHRATRARFRGQRPANTVAVSPRPVTNSAERDLPIPGSPEIRIVVRGRNRRARSPASACSARPCGRRTAQRE